MKLIGIERSDFKTKDGKEITGCNVYVSREIASSKGKGQAVERLYVTDDKASTMSIDLVTAVGKEVLVYYNRYGKADQIVLA